MVASLGRIAVATLVLLLALWFLRSAKAWLLDRLDRTVFPPERVFPRLAADFHPIMVQAGKASSRFFGSQYMLIAHLKDARERAAVLSELHAQIQDAFNEFGTQLMSPNFEAQPETPVLVPKDRWYSPPATSRQGSGALGADTPPPPTT